MATQRLGNGAQRCAQIVQCGAWLGEPGGQNPEVLDNGWVTGHRALDHVREHTYDVFVEDEVGHLLQGLGEKAVGLFAHGESRRLVIGRGRILAKPQPGCMVG
ncbi:hypothetical protein D9M71_602490 [compost metagenome]